MGRLLIIAAGIILLFGFISIDTFRSFSSFIITLAIIASLPLWVGILNLFND